MFLELYDLDLLAEYRHAAANIHINLSFVCLVGVAWVKINHVRTKARVYSSPTTFTDVSTHEDFLFFFIF